MNTIDIIYEIEYIWILKMGVNIHWIHSHFGFGSQYPLGIHSHFLAIQCNFTELKTHVTEKYKEKTENAEETFLKQCSLCNLVYKNKKEMSKQMRTHSYSYVQFRCTYCEFTWGGRNWHGSTFSKTS